ncbi:hypothetical protein LIER_33006 [Lithospermum erythrorhizon]|uniref:Uncharacterized protein n=1 Tax=Lithospermum erythrorhizon TaxID=34254 RepID=A0AAV3RVJ5_LITER
MLEIELNIRNFTSPPPTCIQQRIGESISGSRRESSSTPIDLSTGSRPRRSTLIGVASSLQLFARRDLWSTSLANLTPMRMWVGTRIQSPRIAVGVFLYGGDNRPPSPRPGMEKLKARLYRGKLIDNGVSRFFRRQIKKKIEGFWPHFGDISPGAVYDLESPSELARQVFE